MTCKINLGTYKTARVRHADSRNTWIAFFTVVGPDCRTLPVRHRAGGQSQVTSGLRDLLADFVCFSAVLISALLASTLAAILLMRLRHCSMAGLRACIQKHSSTCSKRNLNLLETQQEVSVEMPVPGMPVSGMPVPGSLCSNHGWIQSLQQRQMKDSPNTDWQSSNDIQKCSMQHCKL